VQKLTGSQHWMRPTKHELWNLFQREREMCIEMIEQVLLVFLSSLTCSMTECCCVDDTSPEHTIVGLSRLSGSWCWQIVHQHRSSSARWYGCPWGLPPWLGGQSNTLVIWWWSYFYWKPLVQCWTELSPLNERRNWRTARVLYRKQIEQIDER